MSHEPAQTSRVLDLERLSECQLVGSCLCERTREGNNNTLVQVLLPSMPEIRSSRVLATGALGTRQQDSS